MMVISAKEYAEMVGVSVSYISKILKKSKALPHARSVEKYGNTWRIRLMDTFEKEAAKNLLKEFY